MTEPTEPTEHLHRCDRCGDERVSVRTPNPNRPLRCVQMHHDDEGWYRCGGRYRLDETPPVPADWYRDGPPRTTAQLFVELVNRAAPERRGMLALELINAAWERIESEEYHGETYRDSWLAALRAEMPTYPPVRSEQPYELGYCRRPNCARKTPHAGPHMNADRDPLCITTSRAGSPPVRHICVRAAGHLGHHAPVAWPEPPKVNF